MTELEIYLFEKNRWCFKVLLLRQDRTGLTFWHNYPIKCQKKNASENVLC